MATIARPKYPAPLSRSTSSASGRKWFFDFHFALKEQVRDAFHRQLHHLPPEFVGVVMDVQERGTLPIGPNEVGE